MTSNLATRMINLVAPIGGGQRAVVSPPKAGKTTILKDTANAISVINPEVRQIMSRSASVLKKSYGPFCWRRLSPAPDEPVSHEDGEVLIAKRLVEMARLVILIFLTRLAPCL